MLTLDESGEANFRRSAQARRRYFATTAPCETVRTRGDLSWREQGNRYGLRHRFIKK
jgi:hypothetical protein